MSKTPVYMLPMGDPYTTWDTAEAKLLCSQGYALSRTCGSAKIVAAYIRNDAIANPVGSHPAT
jgi:hypothetical protein